LIKSDLFSALAGKRYDLILSNPPYVSEEAMAAFPPEYRAEPAVAHAGGGDGMGLARRIISEAGKHLSPSGALVVEVGAGGPLLDRDFPKLPFLWLATEESEGEVFALPASALG
jgi:ribosomal protein L3 glutamine methyltransferase